MFLTPLAKIPALAISSALLSLATVGTASAAWSAPANVPDCRTIPVDADPVIHSDSARERFGVDGSGVTVGVLSDSFGANQQPGHSIENDITNGLLPGEGNPCGRTEPVMVLRDGPTGSTDEGRAMAQVVHGIAPGARLMFAAVDPDEVATLREGIQMLVDAGADVIVDDLSLEDDSLFQRSLTAETIVKATAQGVAYFSSAGNDNQNATLPREGQYSTPINGWETAAYRPMPCPTGIDTTVEGLAGSAPVDCMNFARGNTTDGTLGFTGLPFDEADLLLQWGEPAGDRQARFIPVLLKDGVPFAGAKLSPLQDGTPGYLLSIEPTELRVAELDVVIARVTDPIRPDAVIGPPLYFRFPEEIALESAEYWLSGGDDIVGNTVLGHNGDPAVITVGAAPYTSPDQVETFSSHGPTTHYLSSRASGILPTQLAPAQRTTKPDVTAVDAVHQSAPIGVPDETGAIPFSGTSAAAPVAAAVAALIKSVNQDLSQEPIRALLASTATPMASPFPTTDAANISGAGLINAELALAQTPRPPAPAPTPTPTPSPGAAGAPAGQANSSATMTATRAELAATGSTDIQLLVPSGTAVVLVLAGIALYVLELRRRQVRTSKGHSD